MFAHGDQARRPTLDRRHHAVRQSACRQRRDHLRALFPAAQFNGTQAAQHQHRRGLCCDQSELRHAIRAAVQRLVRLEVAHVGDLCNGQAICVGGVCAQDKTRAIGCVAKGCTGACHKLTGLCTAPVPGGCDDTNACTADLCGKGPSGDNVCEHQPLPDGGACAPGKLCLTGQCQTVPVGMAWVGGSLWMGCNAVVDAQCQSNEKPQHFVTITPLFVDRYEVTTAQYEACVAAGKCSKPIAGDPHCNWGVAGRKDHPINCVTWDQASAYCTAQGKRLPTEAEWELAARGRCKTPTCKQEAPRWPWGNLPVATCAMTAPMLGWACGA